MERNFESHLISGRLKKAKTSDWWDSLLMNNEHRTPILEVFLDLKILNIVLNKNPFIIMNKYDLEVFIKPTYIKMKIKSLEQKMKITN